MTTTFVLDIDRNSARITLVTRTLLGKRILPFDAWFKEAGATLAPAVRYLRRLVDEGLVTEEGDTLEVPLEQLAEMPARVASAIGLPDIAPLSLALDLLGVVESPGGEIRLRWTDENGRALTPRIEGIIIDHGRAAPGRLNAPIWRLVTAVAGYNATRGQPSEQRVASWLPVQSQITRLAGAEVRTDALLRDLRIYQAGAFGLDVRLTPDGPDFEPVLMAPGMRPSLADETAAPEAGVDPDEELRDGAAHALLPPIHARPFLDIFSTPGATRLSYVLQRNTYLVLEPDLRAALEIVKQKRAASSAERREFLRNPRTALALAMPDAGDDVGSLFVETHQYSERVEGLGLWQKPILPWLARKGAGWLPERFVLQVGGHPLEMDEGALERLADALERARAIGSDTITYGGVSLPVSDVEQAIGRLEKAIDPPEPPERTSSRAPEAANRNVLLIADNLEETGFSTPTVRRPLVAPRLLPETVSTLPKQHQLLAFGWLVDAWVSGLPGVLLADDMGLGKTLEALSFLTWFRENRRALRDPADATVGPILVVAPTALLRTWQKEAAIHLSPRALGTCAEAFGAGLTNLRQAHATPEDALHLDAIQSAGWVLTTYETLATYHRAFARVRFPIVVFDEMQKIKSPDTINTHAAKAMNADFVLGMTGTPIENRIEDLWCLMDRVAPGRFGALKPFSARYGKNDHEELRELRRQLDTGQYGQPALMLRRLKEDHIEGLPKRQIRTYPEPRLPPAIPMPPVQAAAYAEVVARAAAGSRTKGDMLRVIHQLRGISLHPYGRGNLRPGDTASIDLWCSESARVGQALEVLGRIRVAGEKAIVFIEDRDVQAAFASALAERFDLAGEPPIINGDVPGDRRQAIVDRFQGLPGGFAVLILSPRAAGMGLTITAANHVVHLSRWWNPAVEDQCNDRVYRIGQARDVTVHIPMAIHQVYGEASFDVRLDALLARKRSLSREMLAPPISEDDAFDLFGETIGRQG